MRGDVMVDQAVRGVSLPASPGAVGTGTFIDATTARSGSDGREGGIDPHGSGDRYHQR